MYYKRNEDNKWKGPGTVIGQDGKKCLLGMEAFMFVYLPVDL